jgi:predicted DNA-binding helix-hairpin-helix protein
MAWALRNPAEFPVNLNRAPRETLLRVPGLGVRNVDRILAIRRWHQLRADDLVRLRVSLKKTLPFIEVADHRPSLIGQAAPVPLKLKQMELFGAPVSVASGQL